MSSCRKEMGAEEEEIGRRYQIAMCELAKEKNCIICLPTGSGKTYIALQLMKFYLPDAVLKDKKIVFLANTVPLVHQQAHYIRKQLFLHCKGKTKSHVTEITGDMNADIWDSYKWSQVTENTKIFVMTSQILLDALSHSYLTFKKINLLILDECHHADKDHPMARIMEKYDKIQREGSYQLPRILGLTATIIKGSLRKKLSMKAEVSDIESRLCCQAVTYHNYEEVLCHSTKADVQIKSYAGSSTEILAVCYKIGDYLESKLKIIQSFGRVFNSDTRPSKIGATSHATLKDPLQIFKKKRSNVDDQIKILNDVKNMFDDDNVGIYGARLAAVLKRSYVDLNTPEERMSALLQGHIDTCLAMVVAECDLAMGNLPKYEQVSMFVSAKVRLLFQILLDWNKEKGQNDTLCGIVFCNERLTAQILTWIFSDAVEFCGDSFKFIKPAFVMGSSRLKNNIEEQRITTKKQEEVIRRFHKKEINLIFATNVLEEGLNVPSCNVVIRFDQMQKYPSFVQSMGRARKRGALFCVLTSEKSLSSSTKLVESFTKFNRDLATHLSEHGTHVDEDDVDHERPSQAEDVSLSIDPSDPDSPTINLTDAVSLVHRYCQLLACDRFVRLEPLSWWTKGVGPDNKIMFKAFVQLPANAVFRDVVEGASRSTKNEAKRVAFLEVCKRLYQCDALDSRLMPCSFVLPKKIIKCIVDMDRKEELNYKKYDSKKFSWYPKMIPNSLQKSSVGAHGDFFVYRIKLSLVKATTDSIEYSHLYNLESKRHTLAVMCMADLNDIPQGYLYSRHGLLEYYFERILLSNGSSLSNEKIARIKKFQDFVFFNILGIKKDLLIGSETDHYFISALIKDDAGNWDIDWTLFRKLDMDNINLTTPNADILDEAARNLLPWSCEDYKDAVVMPWYKSIDLKNPEYYCVSSFRNDLTPDSQMDETNVSSPTYAQHYHHKYSLRIVHRDRPFLVVAPLKKRLNYLTTEKDVRQISKDEQKEKHVPSVQILIPELVKIHPLPASIFVLAKFLPSILHRTSRLLLARQIQVNIGQKFDWTSAINCKVGVGEWALNQMSGDCTDELEDHIQNMSIRNVSQTSFRQISFNNKEFCCSSTLSNGSRSHERKQEFKSLDYVHPDRITVKDINGYKSWKILTNKGKKSTMLELENTTEPISFPYTLPDINDYKFPSLDTRTDFSVASGPTADSIMEAITLANAQDAVSLESLEVIGDSFLKYCVSTQIYCVFSDENEGVMTTLRTKFVSNSYLFFAGSEKNLGGYLSGGIFIPESSWLPPGVMVPPVISQAAVILDKNFDVFVGLEKTEIQKMTVEELTAKLKTSEESISLSHTPHHTTYTHTRLAKKKIADCVEALIGAYYMYSGIDGALRCMDWLNLHGPNDDGKLVPYKRWSAIPHLLKSSENSLISRPEQFLPMVNELENVIQYKFKNKWLLVEAFTHPGYPKNNVTFCYQRLEFLGDAVLDFLVTDHIYKAGLAKTPGRLTDLRSALVNNVTFGSLTIRYGFQKFLLSISKQLQDGIDKFAAYQEENSHAVTGHFKLFNDLEALVAEEIEVPKVLGDLFESLAGAVYVDSKMSLDSTWKVFYRLMKNEIDIFGKKTPRSPIRELTEKIPGIIFRTDEKNHDRSYTVVSVHVNGTNYFGRGSNKRQAKQAAAKYALRHM